MPMPNPSPEISASALRFSTEAALSLATEIDMLDFNLTKKSLPHRAVEFRAFVAFSLRSAAAARALVPLVALGGFDSVGVQRIESALNGISARLHNLLAHGLTVRAGKVEIARSIDEVNVAVGWARAIRSEAQRRLDADTFASLDAKLDEIDTGITDLEVQ